MGLVPDAAGRLRYEVEVEGGGAISLPLVKSGVYPHGAPVATRGFEINFPIERARAPTRHRALDESESESRGHCMRLHDLSSVL